MKKRLLVLVLGVSFLIIMTWVGTMVTEIIPHRPTARVQTIQTDLYQVTLQVDPNPPRITQPATLSLQVLSKNGQRPITAAHITLESDMETMDMGTDRVDAHPQTPGLYEAQVQFSMSGPWQVRVLIAVPGARTVSATFEIVAQ